MQDLPPHIFYYMVVRKSKVEKKDHKNGKNENKTDKKREESRTY